MSKERRRNQHEHITHGAELPDKHPGAVAQRKKKRNVVGMVLLIAAIAGVVYLTTQGG